MTAPWADLARAGHNGAKGGARAPMAAHRFFLDSGNFGESLLLPSSSTVASSRSSPRSSHARVRLVPRGRPHPLLFWGPGEPRFCANNACGTSSPLLPSNQMAVVLGPSHPVPPHPRMQMLPKVLVFRQRNKRLYNNNSRKIPKAMFRSLKLPKILQDSPSHRIFRHMHEALNVGKNN
jgi:hypothetical protein